MSLRMRWSGNCLVVLGLVVLTGCPSGAKPPPKLTTTPVTGTVTIDGVPLVDATVAFIGGSFHGAVGLTNAEGKYELQADLGNGKNQKGCPPGKYKVTVSKLMKQDGTAHTDRTVPPMNVGASESLPMMYQSQEDDNPLSYDVPASGSGTYDIALKAKVAGSL